MNFFSGEAFFFFFWLALLHHRVTQKSTESIYGHQILTPSIQLILQKTFRTLELLFFVSAIYFLLSHYQVSSKEGEKGKVFFLCLIKNLALKLMARFSLHKRGSNEDPGTNNSFMGTEGSKMCPFPRKTSLAIMAYFTTSIIRYKKRLGQIPSFFSW